MAPLAVALGVSRSSDMPEGYEGAGVRHFIRCCKYRPLLKNTGEKASITKSISVAHGATGAFSELGAGVGDTM